jgi:hypothetical protein
MDLGLYARVLRRHKLVTLIGLGLTLLLTLAALVKVSGEGLTLRGTAIYESTTTILVSEAGFPWGRAKLEQIVTDKGAVLPRYGDPDRMQYLATLYANLSESDEVERLVSGSKKLPDPEEYIADVVRSLDGGALPLIEIRARAASEARAVQLANQVSTALRRSITRTQAGAGIPLESRVVLPVVARAEEAEVVQPRRPTKAVMAFLVGCMLTVGAAFLVDNVRGLRPEEQASQLEVVPVEVPRPVTELKRSESEVERSAPAAQVAGRPRWAPGEGRTKARRG